MIVSDKFKGKTLVQRHRMINALLKDELDAGLHALSIQANIPKNYHYRANISSGINTRTVGSKWAQGT